MTCVERGCGTNVSCWQQLLDCTQLVNSVYTAVSSTKGNGLGACVCVSDVTRCSRRQLSSPAPGAATWRTGRRVVFDSVRYINDVINKTEKIDILLNIFIHQKKSVATKWKGKLEGCIVLNEHNTVFAQSGPLYATGVSLGPPESSTQTTSRSLQLVLQGSLGDRPTDRPTAIYP